MSLGLALLLAEAVAVYGLVFATHAARDRFTLTPYFALLGVLAATLRWTTDAGLMYQAGPFTFVVGSVVFFTAILFGVFLLYIFDGVQAAQIGIYIVVAVSIVSPLVAVLFRLQLAEMGADAGQIILSSARVYVASTAAMVFDFLFIAILWEFLSARGGRIPFFVRISLCLLSTFWLDTAVFTVGAFLGEDEFAGILKGNLVSRAALTLLVAPPLTGYVMWVQKYQRHEFAPRSVMAILYRSARRELDLLVAHRELKERKQIEDELRRRDRILESLAFAAENFLNRGRDTIGLAEVLRSLGTAADVSRVYICRNSRTGNGPLTMTQQYTWVSLAQAERTNPAPWEAAPYRKAGFLRWEQSLGSGEAIAGDVKTFPRDEQHALLARGVASVLALPVFVAGEWWGFIGLDECERTRVWPRSEVDALRTAAGTLGAAIQRTRTEEALNESKERLDLALGGGDLGLWDWDIENDCVVFNERWASMLGYELRDIAPTSRSWEELIHPDDMPRVRAAMRANLKGDADSFEYEMRMRARDGAWRWILNKGKVVARDGNGRARRATGTHLDITRLKETEEALRFSQEMFRLMYEESPMGLVLCGLDGNFVQANRAFLHIVGYTEEEIHQFTYFSISPRNREVEEAEVYRSMQLTGRYGPYEFAYLHKGGERVPVLVNGCLVTGAGGKQYIWSIVEDISERKAAERAIAEARRYQREIETRIEETLLRGRPPADLSGVEVAAVNMPTEHMDGDFADFVRLNARCFDVIAGDVMGKGIMAALVSAGAKSHFLRALSAQLAATDRDNYPAPATLVSAVHQGITRQLIDLDCFLTLCYARFDLDAGRVTYVDCGHTKTIRFRVPSDEWTLLEGDNVPIGFLESESYQERSTDLRPGDLYFFYSDGLTETRNGEGSMFGVERLIDTLKLHASLDAAALTRKVVDIVRQFSGSDTHADDQTCVAVKILHEDPAADGAAEQLEIAASVDELVAARTFLQGYLKRRQSVLGDPEEFSRVVLAFVEALSNIIKHACAETLRKPIRLEFRSSPNRLSIGINHGGLQFRPRSTPLPDPKTRKESGYGLYIMNRCFTHIGYETLQGGDQCVTLVKHFDGVKPPPAPDTGPAPQPR